MTFDGVSDESVDLTNYCGQGPQSYEVEYLNGSGEVMWKKCVLELGLGAAEADPKGPAPLSDTTSRALVRMSWQRGVELLGFELRACGRQRALREFLIFASAPPASSARERAETQDNPEALTTAALFQAATAP